MPSSSSYKLLFKLTVPALPSPDESSDKRDRSVGSSAAQTGSISVRAPPDDQRIYVLAFDSPPDNRLTTPVIRTLLLALDILHYRYPLGVVITTSAIQKFYSNGFDLEHVKNTPGFVEREFFTLLRRCLTYPMPMIACINGHGFAGGFMLASVQDYRLMNGRKGFVCLNEIRFGMMMESAMVEIFKQKVPSPRTVRKLILEGHRFPAQEALEAGLIDGLVGMDDQSAMVDEAVNFAIKNELVERSKSGLWGMFKEDLYRETIASLNSHERNLAWRDHVEGENARAKTEAEGRIQKWEAEQKENAKSKL